MMDDNSERLIRRGPGRPRKEVGEDPRMSRDFDSHSTDDDRLLSDPVRMESYMDEDDYTSPVLPNPPPLQDFHQCWVSTAHPQDTPIRRAQFGYSFVTDAEQPLLAHAKIQGGTYAGHIGLNEMVLMKIPMDRYLRMMNKNHSEKPAQERERLNAHVESIADNLRKSGMRMYQDQGDRDARNGWDQLMGPSPRNPFNPARREFDPI